MGPATENTLQRLFSTFAEGWPGFGLLLQRVLTSTILLYFAGANLLQRSSSVPSLPHLMAAVAGALLLFGLWTPLAGSAIAIVEIWIFLARSGNPVIAIMLVSLGATVAMIGPGVWSIDAQLYGRKHIEPSRQ
jgi:putative oxidoreductase